MPDDDDTGIPAFMLAGADQELSQARNVLDGLIVTWQERQLTYDLAGIKDPIQRLATFMFEDVYRGMINIHCDQAPGLWVMALAIAATRLAGTQQDPLENLYEQ